MEIRLRLAGEREAERLKTALYRFREVRNFAPGPTPDISITAGPAGLVSVLDIPEEIEAEAFRRFWDHFRAEPFVSRGLQDF